MRTRNLTGRKVRGLTLNEAQASGLTCLNAQPVFVRAAKSPPHSSGLTVNPILNHTTLVGSLMVGLTIRVGSAQSVPAVIEKYITDRTVAIVTSNSKPSWLRS